MTTSTAATNNPQLPSPLNHPRPQSQADWQQILNQLSTWQSTLSILVPPIQQTPAEIAAGVVPTNYAYAPGDIRRYGAFQSSVDCQSAFNNCLACNGFAYVPSGTWYTSPVTVPTRCLIHGEGYTSLVQPYSSSQTTLFNCAGTGYPTGELQFIRFKDLLLYNRLTSGCTAINSQYVEHTELENVIIDGGFKVNLKVTDGEMIYLRRCRLWSATAWNFTVTYTTGLNGSNVFGYVSMADCEFFNCQSSGISSSQEASVYLQNVASVLAMRCRFNANLQQGLKIEQTYYVLGPQSSNEIYLNQCEFDSNADSGLALNLLRAFTVESCWVSSGRTNAVPGCVVSNSSDGRIIGCDFFANGGDGIAVQSSDDIALIGNSCNANGQASGASSKIGLHLTNCSWCAVISNTCNNINYSYGVANQVTGISSDGTGNLNVIEGNSARANTGAQFFWGGANDLVRNNRGAVTENSGTTGAISSGTTVSHGLVGTPAVVTLTQVSATPVAYSVTAIGTTTFTVDFSGGGTQSFCWIAKTANAP